jgi:hypothetical protein
MKNLSAKCEFWHADSKARCEKQGSVLFAETL